MILCVSQHQGLAGAAAESQCEARDLKAMHTERRGEIKRAK